MIIEPSLAPAAPAGPVAATVEGFVESFGDGEIAGWAVHRGDGALQVELRIEGQPVLADVTWHERGDIAALHGARGQKAGFRMRLAETEAAILRSVLARRGHADVFAGGVPLPRVLGTAAARTAPIVSPAPEAPLDGAQATWEEAADAPAYADEALGFEQTVVGYVESIDREQIVGWAFDQTGAAVQLTLAIGDDIVESERLIWVRRSDISSANHHLFERCGFVIPYSPEEAERVRQTLEAGGEIHVLANGIPLPRAGSDAPPAPVTAEVPTSSSLAAGVRANLERATRFVVSGWAVGAGGAPARITVHANGEPIECLVLPRERRDVQDALQLGTAEVGIDVELPASIWSRATGDDPIRVDVLAEDQPITSEPLWLTTTLAASWVSQIAEMAAGPERDYLSLLAIEHVHAARLLDLLDDRAILHVRWTAGRAKVDGFLAEAGTAPSGSGLPREIGSAVLMRAALRELNQLMAADRGHVIPHLRKVLDNRDFTGQVREWLLYLGVQLTCGTGELPQMRELMDLVELQRFETSNEPHQMSLALPALVVDGELRRATDLLFRLSKRLASGWVHTECLRFCVEHVARLEVAGEAELDAADAFRRALVAVLGGFKGDWFSRLHDEGLIDAFVAALADLDRYADDHRRLLTSAAIWHYGLNPTFWAKWAAGAPRPRNTDLDRAQGAWNRIAAVFAQPRDALPSALPELVEPLEYFHRFGNPEALLYVREFVTSALLAANRAPSDAERRLIEILLDTDPREALRIAAFPTEGPNRVLDAFPETSDRDELTAIVRASASRARGRFGALHRAAAAALRTASDAVRTRDVAGLERALSEVEARASQLMRRDCQYIGVDLLAGAAVLGARGAEPGARVAARVDRIERIVRRIALGAPRAVPAPVPVETACRNLQALAHDEATAHAVRTLRDAVRERFAERRDDPCEEGPAGGPVAIGGTWPSDTLVVIASCRAYLDTRVRTIRETWLPHLVAAGIPYVIAVGDGSGALDGDVLALDAPDGYAQRPQKTLRLLEWVLASTSARFVVKIEDDCQLDVAAYFDALTYRRFAYYGRVVRTRPGDLARVGHGWHVPAADGAPVFDRSPEISAYCDGRTGYALSRGAVAALLAATKTVAGRRLVAASLREDKLVGDLLALAGVAPSDEDYDAYLQARLSADAVPVGVGGDNAFDLGPLSPARISHRGLAAAGDATREPFPKKIWPTVAAPSIAAQGNQLQLLTPAAHAHEVLRAPHAVVAVMRNERELVPHFLAHYRKLGLAAFLVADNGSTDGTREFLLSQPDVVLYSADTDYRQSHYGVSWQQAMLAAHCLGKWVILADADEFLVFDECEHRPFDDLVTAADYEGANAVVTYMVDFYPKGPLDQASFADRPPFAVADHFDAQPLIELHIGGGLYGNTTNFVNALRHRVAPTRIDAYTSQKRAVLKYFPWVRLSEGVHYAANVKAASSRAFLAHFKYHAAFARKVAEEVRRKQHFNDAEEYRHFAAILGAGRSLFEEGVSQRYRGSDDLMAIFDPGRISRAGIEDDDAFGTPGEARGPDA
ncbi:MAG TPA: glycosyltransferase family 2 protein [Nevskiaceae bacterium]|nr:glycosyltransferase family 2 protein [Nevskiaceae bacterium]